MIKVCLLTAILTIANSAIALGEPAKPALPTDLAEKKSLLNLIKWPETHGDANVRLLCQAIVKSSGKTESVSCYARNNWEPDFAEAVSKAGKKARFVPATQDNKGRKVGFYFQVEFLKKGDDKKINIYMNPGLEENVQEYGPEHVAPQRILGKEYWPDVCPKHARWTVLARGFVDENGVASSVNMTHSAGIVPTSPCLQAIVKTVETSRFSPTYVDGEAVPSAMMEYFGI